MSKARAKRAESVFVLPGSSPDGGNVIISPPAISEPGANPVVFPLSNAPLLSSNAVIAAT